MKTRIALCLVCALAAACNDDNNSAGLSGATHDGYFAVVSTNYTGATSISLLDKAGDVATNEWVGSKTKNPDLRTPLAEDVVLPTTSFSRRYLTTIERGIGVVTRFDLNDGSVLGQLRTDASPDDDKAAYHSNPQDVYYVSETSGWVSRWAQNPDDTAKASERGTDLIEFDPATMKRLSRRIDLSKYNTQIDEEQFDDKGNSTGTMKVTATASPGMLVPVSGFLAVGLTRITASYNYAPGMLVIVDPEAGKVTATVDLEGMSNCAEVKPVQDDDRSVIVACIGSYGDGGAAAGLVKVTVDTKGKAAVAETFAIADHDGAADANANIVSLGGDTVVAIASGTLDPTTMKPSTFDEAYAVDLKTGKQKKLYTSKGAYALGTPAFDAATGVLIIPDAGSDDAAIYGVERFTVDKKLTVEDDDFVKVAPKTTLAARQATLL